MAKATVSRDGGVWILGSLCRSHRIPFSPALFLQRYFSPQNGDDCFTIADVCLAAQELSFETDEIPISRPDQLGMLPLPCLAFRRQSTGELTAHAVPLLIVECANAEITYLEYGNEAPQKCDEAEFLRQVVNACWRFTGKFEQLKDQDDAGEEKVQQFGFSWFVPEILRHGKVWREILFASLALQLVGLVTPLLTQVVIDKVVVHQAASTLTAVGIGLAITIAFSGAFSWVRQYLVMHTGNRIDAVLGSKVFAHLLKLPMAYFARRPTGTLVARMQGVETVREFLSGAAVTLLLDLPFVTVLLAVMFWYSWQLSLISLGLLLLLALLSLAVTPMFKLRLNRQFLLGARNQAFMTEYVSGMETVKSLQLEPRLEKRYGGYLAEYLAGGFDTKMLANTYNTFANSLDQLQSLAILVVGALLVMNNDGFTIGMLVAFQMFAGRLSQPMLHMVSLYQQFQQANISVKRLGDLMNAPAEPYSLMPTRATVGPGAIEMRNVSFRYDDDLPWLYRDMSLSFQSGKTTLIVGQSGSGKSTLAKLLLGFHRPAEGNILLDGQDITHMSANELRARFGVVPQETLLFSGTLYENLQMANPLATFKQIAAACKMAEIDDTIERLPKGYQTEIGEHGVGLSGGQKQRIAIARALLKRPRILIFDEATSSLDSQTAEHFARTINQLKGKVTILFIAHQVPKGLQVDQTVIVGVARPAPARVVPDAPIAVGT
jgi:subfamily B ATP-binding cassette protein HlyB/CyaB